MRPGGLGGFAVLSKQTILYLDRGVVHVNTDTGLTFKKMPAEWPRPGATAYGPSVVNGILFAEHGALFKSTDQGKRWVLANRQEGGEVHGAPGGSYYHAASSSGVYASHDGARSWKQLPFDQTVRRIAVRADSTVFAGIDPTADGPFTYIWQSRDKGKTWAAADRGLVSKWGHTVDDLFGAKDGAMFASISGKLYRMHPDGRTWGEVSRGLPGSKECLLDGVVVGGINSLGEAADGTLYAGTRHGVFGSRDRGELWGPSLILKTGF